MYKLASGTPKRLGARSLWISKCSHRASVHVEMPAVSEEKTGITSGLQRRCVSPFSCEGQKVDSTLGKAPFCAAATGQLGSTQQAKRDSDAHDHNYVCVDVE